MSSTTTAADELLAAYRAQKGKQPASAPTSSATSSARASKSASSSTNSPEQQTDPLIALRDQLRAEQTRLTDVQKLIKTFEQLSAGGSSANIADSTLRVNFPRADPGSILKNDPDARPTAFFSAKPSSSGTVYLPPFELDAQTELPSTKPMRCDSYAAAIAELRTRETKLGQRAESLRKEILGVASEAVQQKLGIQLPALDKAGSSSVRQAHEDQLNDKGEVLNEEGLPFFEPMEMLPDEDASRQQSKGKGKARQGETIAPFRPKAQDKASKSAFMDAIFSKLEAEEEEYLANGGDEEGEDAAASRREEDDDADEDMADSQESDHDDDEEAPAPLPSKARPAPAKPALKKAGSYSDPAASIESLPELAPAPSTPKTSKFGASGMKRGFLNLNPSSPAAEHSSDYVDQAFARATAQTSIAATLAAANEAEKREAEALRRRNQAAQAGTTAQSTDDERMSRGSSAGARKKKTVRIRTPSPARARFEDVAGESSSRRNGRLNGADEDVADEAQRIIDLLGPGVVHTDLPGMPGAARAPGPSSITNPVPPYPPKARAAPAKAEDTTPARPPMSRDVLERAPPSTSQQKPVNTSASIAKVSAFKRGFLSGPPKPSPSTSTPFVTSLPSKVDPRTSLGMSALDRATKADEPLEKEREAAGLKPAVPHARPSKAYAEKLRQRQEGEDRENGSAQVADAEDTTQGSRPEGSSSVRFGAVQVGQAASGDSNSRGTRFKEDIKPDAHEHYDDEEEGDGFSEGHESDDSDKPLAFDTDDESGYDSNDLADLRPKMELDSDELEFDSDADLDADLHLAEIQREYARARASLFGDGTAEALRARRSDDMHEHPGQELVPMDTVEEGEGVTASTAKDKGSSSRFKQDRMSRAFGAVSQAHQRREQTERAKMKQSADLRAEEAGHDLTHSVLSGARNLGPDGLSEAAKMDSRQDEGAAGVRPVMLIPQLTPVRFAPGGRTIMEGEQAIRPSKNGKAPAQGGVELEGDSDPDDDRLVEIVRRKIEQAELDEVEAAERALAEQKDGKAGKKMQPGQAISRLGQTDMGSEPSAPAPVEPPVEEAAVEEAPEQPAKVSRFKARRMAQQN